MRWTRLFVVAETAQGCLWSVVVLFAQDTSDPRLATFLLVALLLIAAMNATVTASIPAAVYGALAPVTVAEVVAMRPTQLNGPDALLALLALGTLVYFVVLARDLRVAALQSLNYQAEKDDLIAELERSKANSDLARHRAEESNIAKSRFLATMSHELRTPLNAILGFSEVMKTELFGAHVVPAYKEYAHDIHSSGEHLLMLINEILDLSRVEAGRYELREESVDLRGVLEECRHLMALRAKKKNIVVQEDFGASMPRLWADARALRQVALNLLSNAIKFTPQGGGVRLSFGSTPEGGQFFSRRRHRPRHPRFGDPDHHVLVRPGLLRAEDGGGGHRARPAHREGPGRAPRRHLRAQVADPRRHDGDGALPRRARDERAGPHSRRHRTLSATRRRGACHLRRCAEEGSPSRRALLQGGPPSPSRTSPCRPAACRSTTSARCWRSCPKPPSAPPTPCGRARRS